MRSRIQSAAVGVLLFVGALVWRLTEPSGKYLEVQSLPRGLSVTHQPNPVKAVLNGRSGARFTWMFSTRVEAMEQPLRIVEFGAFTYRFGAWRFGTIFGRPFTAEEFADWYGCEGALVVPGKPCTDHKNYSGGDRLREDRALWYFIGESEDGERFVGASEVRALPERKGD